MTELRNTIVGIIGATVDDMPLDAGDTSRVHVWVYCPDWSPRRAFLTGGDDFLRAFLREGGLKSERIEEMLDPTSFWKNALGAYAQMLVSQQFTIDLVEPAHKTEAAERIEITNIQLCPDYEIVESRLRERMERSS